LLLDWAILHLIFFIVELAFIAEALLEVVDVLYLSISLSLRASVLGNFLKVHLLGKDRCHSTPEQALVVILRHLLLEGS
jgi:hypothetical protein